VSIRQALILSGAVLALSTINACTAEPEPFTLKGSMTLHGNAGRVNGWDTGVGPCEGMSGYDDIRGGASVTVYDATGRVVGTDPLDPGTSTGWRTCKFTFAVPVTPKEESDHYQVEVSHRGKTVVDEEDARMRYIELTLG
jgi:hypothetical protein